MTGYTHHMVEKNLDFNGFAWSCARAFGALILMRDESMDAPIPEKFESDDYYSRRLRETSAKLEQWGKMSHRERLAWAEQHRRENLAYWKKALAERVEQNSKLSEMLEQVEKWTPPTDDHAGLKKFMTEQLTMSIDGTTFIDEEIAKLESPDFAEELVSNRYASLLQDVEYHKKHQRDEAKRVAGRNGWVKALAESVGPPPGSPTAVVDRHDT